MKSSNRYRNVHSCAVERVIQSTDSISFQGPRAHICQDTLLVLSAQLGDYTIISSFQSVKYEKFETIQKCAQLCCRKGHLEHRFYYFSGPTSPKSVVGVVRGSSVNRQCQLSQTADAHKVCGQALASTESAISQFVCLSFFLQVFGVSKTQPNKCTQFVCYCKIFCKPSRCVPRRRGCLQGPRWKNLAG